MAPLVTDDHGQGLLALLETGEDIIFGIRPQAQDVVQAVAVDGVDDLLGADHLRIVVQQAIGDMHRRHTFRRRHR